MERGNGEALIKCKVSLGMFSSEREVIVELPDGRMVAALVDKRHVEVAQDPAPGEKVEGRLKVFVVETRKESAIIDLPQPTIVEGLRFEIPRSFLI